MAECKKILVSGSTGLVGSALVQGLSEVHEVFEIRRHDLHINGKVVCQFSDWTQDELLKKLVSLGGVDIVIHAAGQPTVWRSVKDPLGDAEANILQTIRLLQLSQKLRPAQFIFFSSEAVYGNVQNPSELSERRPITPYGASKLAAEFYLETLLPEETKKLILIPSFVVGEYMTRNVIYDIVIDVVRGNDVSLQYSGESTFNFVAVKNIVHAVAANIAQLAQGRYHLPGVDLSLHEVVSIIAEVTGKDFCVQYGDRTRLACLKTEMKYASAYTKNSCIRSEIEKFAARISVA